MADQGPLILDSATHFGPEARGRVCLAASHAGRYATWLCARAGLRAVILSDAGIGRDRAGVAGLADLDAVSMPGAAVSHLSARIGHGADLHARGVISHANAAARALGVVPGMTAREAAARFAAAPLATRPDPPPVGESRHPIALHPRAFALDSASLVTPEDAGGLVATGSHGGLMGGRPELAIKAPVFAALFNDAGIGIEDAGTTRLPVLDSRGIAAATVDAMTARIGDGRSTYEDGVLSRVNVTARALGLREGMAAREAVARLAAALQKTPSP